MISKNNIFAFDECSILHLCEIGIPAAFSKFFSKQKLFHKNFSKLNYLRNKFNLNKIDKYRFHPINLEANLIKTANELLSKEGNQVRWLGNTLKRQIIEQLEDFLEEEIKTFKIISKNDDFLEIKKIFVDNERSLKRERNIPEDDDLKIISGFMKFNSEGNKYLISEDEHFWGYDDLIQQNFKITIIKEWECHKLA